MVQVHVVISGYVQGIGFRHFVKREAVKLGLKGWVKNISNGKVEAFFQGPREKIEEMAVLCEKGPFLAEVKNVEVKWEEMNEELQSFEIRI